MAEIHELSAEQNNARMKAERDKWVRGQGQQTDYERLTGTNGPQAMGEELARLRELQTLEEAYRSGLKSLEGFANRRSDSAHAELAYERCWHSTNNKATAYANLSGRTLTMPGFVPSTRTLKVITPSEDWLKT